VLLADCRNLLEDSDASAGPAPLHSEWHEGDTQDALAA
jgi:hypothetical protein